MLAGGFYEHVELDSDLDSEISDREDRLYFWDRRGYNTRFAPPCDPNCTCDLCHVSINGRIVSPWLDSDLWAMTEVFNMDEDSGDEQNEDPTYKYTRVQYAKSPDCCGKCYAADPHEIANFVTTKLPDCGFSCLKWIDEGNNDDIEWYFGDVDTSGDENIYTPCPHCTFTLKMYPDCVSHAYIASGLYDVVLGDDGITLQVKRSNDGYWDTHPWPIMGQPRSKRARDTSTDSESAKIRKVEGSTDVHSNH